MRILAWLCVLASLVLVLWAGLGQEVLVETSASTNLDKWYQTWKDPQVRPRLDAARDWLPANLPGPADGWGGGRSRGVDLVLKAPAGAYELELNFFEAHEASPPRLGLSLNGKQLTHIQLPKGQGKGGPYRQINPALTIRLPLTLPGGQAMLGLSTLAGSWAAPARLRLIGSTTFLPAKAGYLMLTRPAYYLGFLLLLLLAVLFRVWGQEGLGKALGSCLLLALSVVFTFVVCEYAFREYLIRVPQARHLAGQDHGGHEEKGTGYNYVTMIQANPDLDIIYNLKPNLDGHFAGHPLRTNSLHMRGPQIDPAPQPGAIRMLGLGDSVMFGWGVTYEQTALTLAGQELAQDLGQPVQTLNLGCPSYNTSVEVAVYRKMGRRYKAKVVALIFMENDFGFPGLMLEPVKRFTWAKSYILEQVIRRLAAHWSGARADREEFISTRHFDKMAGKKEEELSEHERWLKRIQAHYQTMVGEKAVAARFEELAGMLQKDGALGVVIYNPIRLTVGDPGSFEKSAGFVVAAARRAGLRALDMTPIYEDWLRSKGLKHMQDGLWVSDRDWHPNAPAHALMAKALVKEVLASGFLGKK